MPNDNQHDRLDYLVQFMLYIYSVRYGPILIKFACNYVGNIYHTRMFSVHNFKHHYLHQSNIQCYLYSSRHSIYYLQCIKSSLIIENSPPSYWKILFRIKVSSMYFAYSLSYIQHSISEYLHVNTIYLYQLGLYITQSKDEKWHVCKNITYYWIILFLVKSVKWDPTWNVCLSFTVYAICLKFALWSNINQFFL